MRSGNEKRENPSESPLRSDAQRNKEDILSAAVLAFAKDANASLEGIARAAGVGIGTLYRHYPTRETLVEAAYRNEIKKLCDVAPKLLQKYPADVALARFLDRFIEHMDSKPGMIEAIRAIVAADRTPLKLNQSLAMVSDAVAPLIEAGKSEGVLRDDVTVNDFILLKRAIVFAGTEQRQRLAVIMLDGLRCRSPAAESQKRAKKVSRTRKKAQG